MLESGRTGMARFGKGWCGGSDIGMSESGHERHLALSLPSGVAVVRCLPKGILPQGAWHKLSVPGLVNGRLNGDTGPISRKNLHRRSLRRLFEHAGSAQRL